MAATKFVEVKSSNVNGIFEVVSNKGICWLVKDDQGDTFQVQKKLVVRGPWEESEAEDEPAAVAATSVAAQLTAAVAAPKKAKDEPAPRDPNLVTLKELCFDLGIEPRIARRHLRKAVSAVGTGHRWEWTKGSEDLAKVTAILSPKQ